MKIGNKNEKTKRVAIFIDGSNFYYKLRAFGISNAIYFGYGDFASWLANGREIMDKRYYVGVVRAKDEEKPTKTLQ